MQYHMHPLICFPVTYLAGSRRVKGTTRLFVQCGSYSKMTINVKQQLCNKMHCFQETSLTQVNDKL